MAAPKVSVIVPAYNRAHYAAESIRSIVRQTWRDLEIVVVDDGSTDDTVAVVRAIDDPRIRLVQHPANRGIPATRNTGLEAAHGEFIAWLDSDDLARPHRIERQVRFLEAHPEIAAVGSGVGRIRADGRRRRGVRYLPFGSDDICAWMLFRTPLLQSAMTGRARILREARYDEDNPVCEDLDVLNRLVGTHRLYNLPEILTDVRVHPQRSVRERSTDVHASKLRLLADPLRRLGVAFDDDDLARHIQLGKPQNSRLDADFLAWADNWLTTLRLANERSGQVDRQSLALVSGYFWARACRRAVSCLGPVQAARAFANSEHSRGLAGHHGRAWLRQSAVLAARSLI